MYSVSSEKCWQVLPFSKYNSKFKTLRLKISNNLNMNPKLITAFTHIIYTQNYNTRLSSLFNSSYLQHSINSKFHLHFQKKWNSSDISCVQTKHQQFNINTLKYSTMHKHPIHNFVIQYHHLYCKLDAFKEIWISEKLMSRDGGKWYWYKFMYDM